MPEQNPHIWIIVPAFNEASRLPIVLQSLCGEYANIVVVDDASTDDTAEAAQRFPVWVLRHDVNLGQGAAIQTGLDFAVGQGAEVVVTYDADGQHDQADIAKLVQAIHTQNVDYVLGSRFLGMATNIPWTRWLVLKAAVIFTRLSTGMKVTDTHNGIRAMTKRGAARIQITLNRMEHASQILEQIAHSKLSYTELPVTIHYTTESLKKGQRSSAALRMGIRLVLERLMS